jgi:hypothetical protein
MEVLGGIANYFARFFLEHPPVIYMLEENMALEVPFKSSKVPRKFRKNNSEFLTEF